MVFNLYSIDSHAYHSGQFVKPWNSGSEAFLSSSSTSQILCYTSMESHVDIRAPADNYTYDLWGCTRDPSLTFKALLVNFFKELGIPCPGLFMQAWVHFNNVDVDTIDKEYYWCRVFFCATTGSYDLESSDTMIFLVLSKIHYDSCSIFRWNGLMIMLCCIHLGCMDH